MHRGHGGVELRSSTRKGVWGPKQGEEGVQLGKEGAGCIQRLEIGYI